MKLFKRTNAHFNRMTVATLLVALSLGTMVPSSRAQDLDEDIDAELDEVVEGEPSAAAESSSEDEIELELEDETQTAEAAPTPAPQATEDEDLDLEEEEEVEVAVPEKPEDELELDEGGEEAVAQPEPTVEPQPVAEPEPATEPEPTLEAGTEPAPEAPSEEPKKSMATNLFAEPNLEYEKRLNRITKGFKDVPDENWTDVIGEKSQEIYSLQPRDTLWDISNTFFGDGNFWAKLWSQNNVIENPHMILKGKAIKFVAGTEAEAPSVGIMDNLVATNGGASKPSSETFEAPTYREDIIGEITPEELESGITLETSELIPAPTLPPPSKRVPFTKEIPRSFRERRIELDAGYDATGLAGGVPIRATEPATAFLNSFLSDRTPQTIGTLVEIDRQEKLATFGQTIIVKLDEQYDIGDRITLVRIGKRPEGSPGPIVYIGGIAQISGIVNQKRNMYRAKITSVVSQVEVGSKVMAIAPPITTWSRNGRRSEVEVTVIGAEFAENRRIVGEGSVIYLNGGAIAGLKVGDLLGVQERRETRRPSTEFPNIIRPIGLLKVADVKDRVATAILLESHDEVRPGDLTGGEIPEAQSGLNTETALEAVAPFKKK